MEFKFKLIASALFVFCFCFKGKIFTEASNTRKPNVKGVQIDQGRVLDCVDIYSQPSLNHPLLKNHKLQLKPSASPQDPKKRAISTTRPSPESGFFRKETCPDGTVPIYRTTEEEKSIGKKLAKRMFQNIGNDSNAAPSNTHEILIRMKNAMYLGGVGTTSIYGLNITVQQISTSNVMLKAGPGDQFHYVIGGSMISPWYNGDNLPRIFTYWSAGGGTGCYDLICDGFIQTNPNVGPKTAIQPVSKIGGDTYEMKFEVYQDPVTQNWWFVVSERNDIVGYWPKELVPNLANGATDVSWGGVAMGEGTSPPMGSGQYPDGFYDSAAYFRHIQYMTRSLNLTSPKSIEPNLEEVIMDTTGCFKLQNDKLTSSDYWGYRFAFGGPGGGSSCKH